MAIDLNRRNAFSQAFKLYPHIIQEFVSQSCVLVPVSVAGNDNGKAKPEFGRPPETEEEANNACLCVMAQFFVRCLATRGQGGGEEWKQFAIDTKSDYDNFLRRQIGANVIRAATREHGAVLEFERQMMRMLVDALAAEVQAHEEAGSDAEWDEVDFWRDFFLCFNIHTRPDGPRWVLASQSVVDYDALKKVFETENKPHD